MIPQIANHNQRPAYLEYNTRLDESLHAPAAGAHQEALLPYSSQHPDTPSSSLRQQGFLNEPPNAPRWGHMSDGRSSQPLTSQYNDPGEHMLRRKTPNGTLAAGYNGEGRAAMKQIVLPLSGPCQDHTHSSDLYLQGRDSSDIEWNHREPRFESRPAVDGDMQSNNTTWANGTYLPSFGNQVQHIPGQTSNNHGPALFGYNGMQIPTVLQPAWQPSPGPTASNDGGLYGPYWPDGRYVPYRPAAFQDHGRYGLNHYWGGGRDQQESYHGAFPAHRSFTHNIDSTPREPPMFAVPPKFNLTRVDSGYGTTQNLSINSNVQYTPDGNERRTPTGYSNFNRANNAHFKERTLSWAHSIYVELLAFLHQSKKDPGHLKPHGSRSHSKNSIFPKPPRQPYPHFESSAWAANRRTEQSQTGHVINVSGHGSPERDPTARLDTASTYSGDSFVQWPGKAEPAARRQSYIATQVTPHYMSPFQSVNISTGSPSSKARDALEILTTLCEQSEWCWIDGMLLGGCLAYGLEEYQKALDWYSKIIVIDPKHVEAMSNLAATLLCLGRREEAEQHWLQSVKLRPSYFEAVEHVIGLLCGDHRGYEAVGIIEFVEKSLRLPGREESHDLTSETSSSTDHDSCGSFSSEYTALDYDYGLSSQALARNGVPDLSHPGFGSSGFAIPGSENGRILALVHAKGNMLYALGHTSRAAKAFEDAVLISAGTRQHGIQGLIRRITHVLSFDSWAKLRTGFETPASQGTSPPLLLPPDKALQTARLVFPKNGSLPGLCHVPEGVARRAAISTTSNSLLSLAKIFQDAMSKTSSSQKFTMMPSGIGDILALYYLSLSLQPSPSTANNVGILLASVQQPASTRPLIQQGNFIQSTIPGVVPGSGVALALAYYNYGLNLDAKHAHLYTNLGSLLKDIGQLTAAIKMYEQAVACDSTFDIALANLANAVKDQGRTSDAIEYYRRAVASSPDFAEAVCGLANALNSVCDWAGRGGVILDGGKRDRWHVDESGMITEARSNGNGSGWMKRVVDIVEKQLKDGCNWGRGTLNDQSLPKFLLQLEAAESGVKWSVDRRTSMRAALRAWSGHPWEGARLTRLVERATKIATHRWYQDKYISKTNFPESCYPRPEFPSSLSVPSAPTVLPFHTFTCPLSAKDIRKISQRNALRISCSTLKAPWMPECVFAPPSPPAPQLNIGYVSSDFNNHPLAHLMQSVFGFHNPLRAKAFCYALTASDRSVHRQQIEREAPVFRDVHDWPAERLVKQIVQDNIHILVNLNGYTRGARNEVFAARPAPIQMSFMGFAGTLGAEWCDYILADETAIPPETLRPWRRNIDLQDQILDEEACEEEGWVYSENIIFCRDTFFCCDHAQSESPESRMSWEDEQTKRWRMRKNLFPNLSDDAIILGNFNQLYKIEPTTFRTWLRILDKVPKAILWLLRFPDLGESNLKRTAQEWAGESVASRIWFTDVAPKHQHISRARVCDLFLDTPECNAHTTAADILWSSTPLLTLPRYKYKMCSRMAASILKGALPRNEDGKQAAAELIAKDDQQYEEFAIRLATGFSYEAHPSGRGEGVGRLGELRKLLFDSRWTCALFDTRRWVRDLEDAYEEAWRRWVDNEGGDIYL
ncbi:TPR-like protein [Coleophoma cylindrospora]|uniref:protein O-GlcNAc transferase n=1 Tax=Coleophoma cylindrospora TaxID=1849047 RepID=A0A3D8SE39_9HELO|nr:TPR-like protein [Coleophoma cylindrospora]